MPTVTPEQLQKLQKNTNNVRNICILAHVDHGKTTLTDALISTNGIISPKLAGKIRYMDNTDAEQRKQITMKASSISLLYKHKKRGKDTVEEDYLVNLVDSPGHVDFSGEVSTAVRLTDGGVVVVDVVEGVCIQTQAVIRQAWSEKVQPCLLLNKIDRLITELNLTPTEAYQRLKTILEQVNVICSTLWKEDLASLYEEREKMEQAKSKKQKGKASDWTLEEADDSDVYFSPERGNVAFSSAFDGWGFRIDQFADLYAEKLKISRRLLLKTLWGEYYINTKSKRIFSRDTTGTLTPMFVKFVLNNIWEVHNAVLEQNRRKIGAIIKSLSLPLKPEELRIENTQETTQAIMSKWLPISAALLGMVVDQLPSPVAAQPRRMPKLWSPASALEVKALSFEDRRSYRKMVHSVMTCDVSEEAPVVAYVAKVFALDKATALPQRNMPVIRQPRQPRARPGQPAVKPEPEKPKEIEKEKEKEKEKEDKPELSREKEEIDLDMERQFLEDEDDEDDADSGLKRKVKKKRVAETTGPEDKVWVAFARIFSGVLKEGQKVYVLGPRYDPRNPTHHRSVVEIKELYMLMGRELERVSSVPAGCVFGIGGVDDIILKTATISTTKLCPPFSNMVFGFSPIVRVAVEPKNPAEMPKLVDGLRLLNQADPCVEILVQETGEHVILASGELHLERCLEDLKTRFAKIEMEVYPPIVSFRETITADLANEVKSDLVDVTTTNKRCKMQIRAIPIPNSITTFLENAANQNVLRQILVKTNATVESRLRAKEEKSKEEEGEPKELEGEKEESQYMESFKKDLFEVFEKAENGEFWLNELKNHLWSFGPKRVGANMLLNHVKGFHNSRYWQSLSQRIGFVPATESAPSSPGEEGDKNAKADAIRKLDNSFVSGFQLATASGPLCEEPMTGIAFVVEDIAIVEDALDDETIVPQGPFSGQIISTMKESCRSAFMKHGVRIVEPMYLCDIQVSMAALGKAVSVISKRRGRITEQDVRLGTDYFGIRAFLPVYSSFGFTEEMRDTTSGAASVQLVFSHWEMLDSDPFFVPTTEEEKEEYGESAESLPPPLSRTIIDDVRRRKGLHVKEKIVEKAEQQRNLSKKK